jgi:hypothetical protein
MMKLVAVWLLPFVLAACGAGEAVGTAAVGGKTEADEINAGKQLEAQTKSQVEQALAAEQRNVNDAESAAR